MTSNANENVKHSSLLMQGRVRRKTKHVPCLHEHMRRLTYDEQRERECETFESAYARQSQKEESEEFINEKGE